MIEEPLHVLLQAVWLFAAGMYPLGFLFGACSSCCDETDGCQWLVNLDGCLKVTAVGSSPETGTTCSIGSIRTGFPFPPNSVGGASIASGGVGFTALAVPLESEVSVTLRISRLNPPTSTRTVVYRIPQSHCTSGCANDSLAVAYDDSSPGWHLEIELTVNVVNEQSLSGIVSQTVGKDSADQPKLFWEVNYFHRPAFDFLANSNPILIRPSGIQKLYRISGAGVVIAGDGAGIGITLRNASVTKQTTAIAFAGNICTLPGFSTFLRTKYTFDQVSEFLAGETFRVDAISGLQQFDLQLMPSTVLCDISANNLGVGVAIEAYPDTIYIDTGLSDPCFGDISVEAQADATDTFNQVNVDFQNANLQLRGDNSGCISSWHRSYRTPTKSSPPFGVIGTYDAAKAFPSDFFAGHSLLWNIGKAPFRRSFSGLSLFNLPVTFRLDGAASQASGYYQSGFANTPCRPGLTHLINANWCVPETITVSFSEFTISGIARRHLGGSTTLNDFNYAPQEPLSGTLPGGTASLPIGSTPLLLDNNDSNRDLNTAVANTFANFFASQEGTALIAYASREAPAAIAMENGTTFNSAGGLPPTAVLYTAAIYYNPCAPVQNVTPVGLVVVGQGPVLDSLYNADGSFWGVFNWQSPLTSAFGFFDLTRNELRDYQFGSQELSCDPVEIRSRLRKVCRPWGPTQLSAAGGTLTRECDLQDAPGETYQTISESTEYPASRNLTDRVIGGGVIQSGVCKLVSLQGPAGTGVQWQFLNPSQHQFLTAAEPCLYLRPIFRTSQSGVACDSGSFYGYPARLTDGDDSPCLSDCTIAVAVVVNSEQLAAEYLTTGDKEGLIQLTAKEGWGDSSTAMLVVSCGEDSIEVTITGS